MVSLILLNAPFKRKFLKDHGLASLLESPSGLLLVCDCVNCVRLLKKGGFNPSNVMDVTLLYSTVSSVPLKVFVVVTVEKKGSWRRSRP